MKDAAIEVARDCEALLIPSGEKIILKKGAPVVVSQALGGAYTVITGQGYLARIAGAHADAIGRAAAPAKAPAESDRPLEARVWEVLRTVYDPEIPVDIVELGLVYDLEIRPTKGGAHRVVVRMTLTAPGCGIGDVLKDDVERRLASLAGVGEAEVEWVWDPPWDASRMSEAAKLQVGLF